MWSSCCCESGECQISKTDWDGNLENTFEVTNMVARASTVLTKNTADGSTLAFQDYDEKPWGSYPTLTTVPQQPCLEVATSIEWRPSPGDDIASAYMFGQTYDDLKFQPTGQNLRWGGSIDFSLRYLESRANLSPTNTNVLQQFAAASTTPPVGPANAFRSVTIWLAARQNGVNYVKLWQGDVFNLFGANGGFFVEGLAGVGYAASGGVESQANPIPTLQTGTWIRVGAGLSAPTKFLSNLDPFAYEYDRRWVKAVAEDVPGRAGIFGGAGDTFPQATLDWCAGAAPIYFGWAVSVLGRLRSTESSLTSTTHPYQVDTIWNQTIRIDRICLNIQEDPSPACPCFDTCFKFEWPGGSFTRTTETFTTNAGEYFLPRYVSTGLKQYWWDLYGVVRTPDWCVFGHDFQVLNSTTQMSSILFINKSNRHALIGVSCEQTVYWNSTKPNQIVFYACNQFSSSGGEFVRVPLSVLGGVQAINYDWLQLADLFNADLYRQDSSVGLILDSFPNSLTVSYVRCDGSPAFPVVAAGSCIGACVYGAEAVAGGGGGWRWKYVGDPSVNPCEPECRCYAKTYPDVTKYGFPSSSTDRLFVKCAPRSNHAPGGTQAVVSLGRNNDWVFSQTDFGFVDLNDTPPDQMLAVKITTLSPRGSMRLLGALIVPGQIIPVHDLDAGNFVFRPATDAFGVGYGVFSFQVIDNGGTDRGGIDTELVPKSFVINVT
jgi:hypothetical protein